MSLNNITPLIIGKEFLLEDDLFISGFNPHVSANRTLVNANATNDIYKALTTQHQTTGKLYIFDTTNFREPTKEEFQEIVRYEDFYGSSNLSDSPFLSEANKLRIANSEIPYKPATFFPVNISYDYYDPYLTANEEASVQNLQKRVIKVITQNPSDVTGISPIFDSTNPDQNINLYKTGIFGILIIDTLGTNKTYRDINETTPLTAAKSIYLIPSNNILITDNEESLNTIGFNDYILTNTDFSNLTEAELQALIDEDQLDTGNPNYKNIKDRLPRKLKILIKSGSSQFDIFTNPNYSYMFPDEISTLKLPTVLGNTLNKKVPDTCIAIYNLNDTNLVNPGGGYPLTSITGTDADTFVPGKFNKAAKFTGDTKFVRSSTDILAKITSSGPQSWTINFWIKPDAVQVAGAGIIGYRTSMSTSSFRIIHPTTDGSVIKFIGDALGGVPITVEGISTTEWSMITVVNENDPSSPNYTETQNVGNAKVYVNGELKGTGSGFVCTVSNIFSIGKLEGAAAGVGFKGLMEQVRIFRKALSPEEINSYNLVNEKMILTQEEKDARSRKILPDFTNQEEITLTDAMGVGGTVIQTHSKVYLYIGRSTATSTNNINSQDQNKSYVADIDPDTGKVGNFTYFGTDPLGRHGLPYVYQDPVTKTGWVYSFPYYQYSTAGYTHIIKIAPINADGTIGTWINANLTHTETGMVGKIIAHPEDPSIFYSTWSANPTVNTKKIIAWKINPNGQLVKLSEVTSTSGDSADTEMIILRAPNDPTINPNSAEYFLYKFGYSADISSTPVWQNKILRYSIKNNIISSTFEIVGTYGSISTAMHLISDDINVYLVGGNSGSGGVYGATNQIVKIPKKDLITCTTTNLINFPVSQETLKYPVNGYVKETKYGWYLYPSYTTYSGGTSYSWDANIKKVIVIPKVSSQAETLLLPDLINNPNTLDTKIIKLNKLGTRFIHENYNNLFVKTKITSTNLQAYNRTITFKDPVNNSILTPIDITKPRVISLDEKFLLEYITKLSIEDNLDKYNEYLYMYDKLNTDRLFDIIIQEIIFLILTDRNFININKEVLTWYLNHETLNPVSLGLEIPETFNLDNSLYRLYKFVVDVNINVPVTYSTLGPQILKATKTETSNPTDVTGNIVGNGYILPKITNIDFGSLETNFDYIFIPQRNDIKKNKDTISLNLPYVGGTTKPLEITSLITPKITEEFSLPVNIEIDDRLWYFISPNGNDDNNGLHPTKPLKTCINIPADSYIALLPGTYSGYQTPAPDIYFNLLNCFKGLKTKHRFYGYGNLTVLDYTDATTSLDKPVMGANSESGISNVILSNCVVNWNNLGANPTSFSQSLGRAIPELLFDYVTFNLTSYYYSTSFFNVATYNKCTFNGGRRTSNYNGIITSYTTTVKATKDISGPNKYEIPLNELNTINKLKQNYTIKPSYTLIPLNDKDNISGQLEESNEFKKSVVLDINTNITNINNTNIKL